VFLLAFASLWFKLPSPKTGFEGLSLTSFSPSCFFVPLRLCGSNTLFQKQLREPQPDIILSFVYLLAFASLWFKLPSPKTGFEGLSLTPLAGVSL
jgi:hypothetical protein